MCNKPSKPEDACQHQMAKILAAKPTRDRKHWREEPETKGNSGIVPPADTAYQRGPDELVAATRNKHTKGDDSCDEE